MNDDEVRQNEAATDTRVPGRTEPPRHILLVEDDEDIRRLNAEVLISSGYRVDTAEDGAVAWDSLQLRSYDLLVTDNEMPRVTGVELLKKLHDARMALPVIMATGKYPQAGFDRHPGIQPTAMLFKPYTIDEFLVTVKEVLRTTAGAREQLALPLGWPSRPATNGVRLE